jgi:hypothetical protein
MLDFPWDNNVLFDGKITPATKLPYIYLPKLITIQITEPAILLFLLGLVWVVFQVKRGNLYKGKFFMIWLWIFLPLILVVVSQPVMYDNSRQFFFILPPLFIFAGFALDFISSRTKSRIVFVLLVILFMLPGIFQTVDLHPYQYIYYNSLVGGVEGAYQRYELDYWGTSIQEAMAFINQHTEENSKILILGGPLWLVQNHAREDLYAESFNDVSPDSYSHYDYEIILNRTNKIKNENKILGPTILEITRDEGILSIVVEIEK